MSNEVDVAHIESLTLFLFLRRNKAQIMLFILRSPFNYNEE